MSEFIPENDGIDHINIYSKGKTTLGRLMSNWAMVDFDLGQLWGRFESVEGFWYWLSTDHPDKEKLRGMWGYQAKNAGRLMREMYPAEKMEFSQFKELIRMALQAKVNQHAELERMLAESTLPFTHYYVFGGKKKEAGQEWQLELWEEIRKRAKIAVRARQE